MNGIATIRLALASTKQILEMLIGDLSDADLLVRPVAGANHIAWQIGHLISGEAGIVRVQIPAAAYPELPAGWSETYANANTSCDDASRFHSKAEYLAWFDKTRAATLAIVDTLSDDDLDRPTTGNFAAFAPNLGAVLMLAANHVTMHAGQFSVIRRKLGKPVLM